MARWLASQGFPAARPYPDVAQPTEAAGKPVTFWEFTDGRDGDRGDIATLAELLSRLHRLPPPEGFTLPADDPLGPGPPAPRGGERDRPRQGVPSRPARNHPG